ncbi:MAG: hypothetical protein ISR80_01260 [Nitrosopumilus sp.]|nr:hypothetical protein [Nitrosopumilus sp.]
MSFLTYSSDKVHVHRWPQDSQIWDDSIQKELDESINKNPEKIPITIKEKTILVGNIEFYSLKKIGITVPFFKKECTIIFEAQLGDLFAHVHITIKSENYVDIFAELTLWKNKNFPED